MRLPSIGRPLRLAAAALAVAAAAPSVALAGDSFLVYTSRLDFESAVSGLGATALDADGIAYGNDGAGFLTGPTPTSVAFTFSPLGSATDETFTMNLLGLDGNVFAVGFDYEYAGTDAGSLVASGTLGSVFGSSFTGTAPTPFAPGSGFFGVAISGFPFGIPGQPGFPESEIASLVASANGGTLTLTNLTTVTSASVVPEPATVTLLGLGLAGLAGVGAHRRRRGLTA